MDPARVSGSNVISHARADHLAEIHLFPEVSLVVPPAEVAEVREPETLLSGFGMA